MKILKENFGNIYYTFDDPISAREFFSDKLDRTVHNMSPLHLQEVTQYEKNLLPALAHEIVSRQQKCVVITIFNLIAVVINHSLAVGLNLTIENLTEEVHWLRNIIESFRGLVETTNIEKSIEDAFIVHSNLIRLSSEKLIQLVKNSVNQGDINPKILKAYALSDSTMTKSVPFVMLQIYVNPVLQYFVDGACLVTVLSKSSRLTKGELNFLMNDWNSTYVGTLNQWSQYIPFSYFTGVLLSF